MLKYLSLALVIFFSIVIVLNIFAIPQSNEIKIYCAQRNLNSVIIHLNNLVSGESIKFLLVPDNSEANITVNFMENIGDPKAAAISYPLFGRVDISNSLPEDEIYVVLIHEFLHCAGLGHEPDDPTSVMFNNSQRYGKLKKRHIPYLKRLVGIGFFGRIWSQVIIIL